MSDEGSVEDALSRARAAKIREIDAHRRAITIHEEAVILFDQLRQEGKSARALERAARAREMLRLAQSRSAPLLALDRWTRGESRLVRACPCACAPHAYWCC